MPPLNHTSHQLRNPNSLTKAEDALLRALVMAHGHYGKASEMLGIKKSGAIKRMRLVRDKLGVETNAEAIETLKEMRCD